MNDTSGSPDNIYALLAGQAALCEHLVAVSSESASITYRDLIDQIDLLSIKLFQYAKGQKKITVILLEPSVDFIVIMFACLKIGFPYIPLNSAYPDKHIKKILADSGAKILITLDKMRFASLPSIQIVDIAELESLSIQKNIELPEIMHGDDAYIIYTSGSTGTPKGVRVAHDSIVALIKNTRSIYHINEKDRVPLFHSLAFDVSIWEICASLLNGSRLVIPTESEKMSLDDYLSFLKKNEITIINLTPSMFYLLLEKFVESPIDLKFLTLRLVLLAGEPLKPKKIKDWFTLKFNKTPSIFNMYGITEGCVHSSYLEIIESMTLSSESLIGVGLPHVDMSIVDESNEIITDPNICGEICLRGISVAKEYFKEPALTAEKFFFDEQGSWCFKTGDLAKKKEDGAFEYVGRKDRRLKIRGFRVDPLEIEKVLLSMEGVNNAMVLAASKADFESELIAFLEGDARHIELLKIKSNLQKELPSYMIPSQFNITKRFPVTANGKVDTSGLLQHSRFGITCQSGMDSKKTKSPEVTQVSLTHQIQNIWSKLLNLDSVDIDQNFFDAGGNSLLLIRLHLKLQRTLGKFKIIYLVKYPSIRKFVNFLISEGKI